MFLCNTRLLVFFFLLGFRFRIAGCLDDAGMQRCGEGRYQFVIWLVGVRYRFGHVRRDIVNFTVKQRA